MENYKINDPEIVVDDDLQGCGELDGDTGRENSSCTSPVDGTITSDKVRTANEILSLIDRIKGIKWRDLLGGITKFFTLIVSIMFIAFILNPRPFVEYYLDIQSKIQTEQHMDLIDKRVQNTPYINTYLDALRVEAGTSFNRTCIFEFHNGNNSVAGLPFYWGDMTYESTDSDVAGVRDNWNSISLTRYNFNIQFFREGYFTGSIHDIERIDTKFAHKLQEDDITYVSMLPILDDSGRIVGAVAMSSDKEDTSSINKADALEVLHRYEAKLKPLLLGR